MTLQYQICKPVMNIHHKTGSLSVCSGNFTGCAFRSGLHSDWRHSPFAVSTAQHQPIYLAETLNRVADVDSRRRLRSGSSPALLVPTTRRCTLGDRAFPVAAARAWNSLPLTVTSQTSLLMFRRQLKTALFDRSYP